MTYRRSLKPFALIPSVYGAAAWIGLSLLVVTNPLGAKLSLAAWLIYAYVLLVFAASIALNADRAQSAALAARRPLVRAGDLLFFVVCSVIGLYGLYLYIIDFASLFGSVSWFFASLLGESREVRGMQAELESIGTQISYLSWIAIFFGLFIGLRSSLPVTVKAVGLAVATSFFIMNLAFVDRTRPTWIFVVCAMGLLFSRPLDRIRLGRTAGILTIVPIAIFVGYALFSERYDVSRGLVGEAYLYIVGGIAYLDSLLGTFRPGDFTLVRTFLPVSKLIEAAGFLSDVPPEVLQFRPVPFWTNVGTFIEPLYSDGGIFLVIVGLPLIVLAIDRIALWGFRDGGIMGKFIWANMVFVSLISFFVPRYQSTTIYLFLALFMTAKGVQALTRKPAPAPRPVAAGQGL